MTSLRIPRPRPAPALVALVLLLSILGCTVEYRLGGRPEVVTVRVAADEEWTDTGVDVRRGKRLEIEYVQGMWSPWPGGSYDAIGFGGDPRCDCNRVLGISHAALIGRLGDGEPFLVGNYWESVVGEEDRLFLGINDARLGDNSGWLEVRIQIGS